MQRNKAITPHVTHLLARRSDLIQLIVVAAILALGVSLLSSIIQASFRLPVWSLLIISGSLIIVAVLWVIRISFSNLASSRTFRAFFIINKEKNRLVPVPGYSFSGDLFRALEGVFVENKALASTWDKDPIARFDPPKKPSAPTGKEVNGDTSGQEKDAGKPKVDYVAIYRVYLPEDSPQPKAIRLLREAIEFVVIEYLSTNLSGYFQEYADEDAYIKEFQRKDIPSILLENRVLSLLSTPLEDREAFIDAFSGKHGKPEGEIHLVYGSDGSMYSRFDLVLPKGTTVSRPKPGVIQLENNRIKMCLKVDCGRFTANVPPDFLALYVGEKPDREKIESKLVQICLEYEVKPLALLHPSGWEYYRWVDSFAETLQERVDSDSFFRRINWDTLSAHFLAMRNQQRMCQERKR